MAYDEAKLRELAMILAWKCRDDPYLGRIKLTKLLAYADFRAYQHLGNSITGATYLKLPQGPAPQEGNGLFNLLRAMGRVEIREEQVIDFTQDRIIARDEGKLDVLTVAEHAIVDEVVAAFKGFNNREMRDASHRDFTGWELAPNQRDEIPYATVFLSPPDVVGAR